MKTNQLIGPALDWAVQWAHNPTGPTGAGWYERDANNKLFDPLNEYTISPSTDWAQGGPIIEREEICTKRRAPCMKGEEWEAMGSITAKGTGYRYAIGPTPLIAAMRCYVASKLGDEVDVPEELT